MDIKSKIESLLFASGEPVTITKLAKILHEKESVVLNVLKKWQQQLIDDKRGIRLLQKEKSWMLVTAPEATNLVQKLRKITLESNLTPVAGETLAIIAYRGPLTRAEVNSLRGVESSYILRHLLLRGLIERSPHPQRNNSYLYKVSFQFLQHLGIKSEKDLPQYDEFQKLIQN